MKWFYKIVHSGTEVMQKRIIYCSIKLGNSPRYESETVGIVRTMPTWRHYGKTGALKETNRGVDDDSTEQWLKQQKLSAAGRFN